MSRSAVVALTDRRWFDFLSSIAVEGRLDEVNFWRPQAQTDFRTLQPGEPFFLRLKAPVNAIAGYGFFAHSTRLPIPLAWEAFEQRNGDETFDGFVTRIGEYRGLSHREVLRDSRDLTCIILRDVQFLAVELWRSWNDAEEWSRNIVAYKGYDLTEGAGLILSDLLTLGRPEELTASYQPLVADERERYEVPTYVREGQGLFRVRVLDAYHRRCAITGEKSLPVLDAAHIEPYRGPKSNHVQNGLVLRADIHRLFDNGYVTVSPDYRFLVSRRLKDDFENGRVYYDFDGAPLKVVPENPSDRPSREALTWHAEHVFR